MADGSVSAPGFLYLVAEFENGKAGDWTKIGVTARETGWRIRNLRQGNPRELRFVAAYKFASAKDAAAAEYALIQEHRSHASAHRPDWIRTPWPSIEARCTQLGFEKAAIAN